MRRHRSPRAPAKGYNASMASTAHTDEMIKAAFGFLIEELGFELMDSHVGQRESSVTFCSPLVRVQVHVDHLPLGVHVGVGLFEKKGQRTMVDEHGLVDVVWDQAPEEAARLLAEVESLEEALAVHAELLRRHAADFLRGERRFLDLGEEEVRAILDDWDQL